MDNKNVTVNFGGFLSTGLTILFIALKLLGIIDWAWVWVLAPLWISFAIGVAIVLIYLFIMLVIIKFFD